MTVQQTNNPLLDSLKARLPGETFRLPSMGYFYTNSDVLSPDVKDGEVHVYPLTAIDEIILGTPDKLLNGTAVTEVFSRCIPQIQEPANLLSKDVDFLLACLRFVTYGADATVSYTHNCEGAKSNDYNVSLHAQITQAKNIDLTTVDQQFSKRLDNGQLVEFHPPVYADVIDLYQSIVLKKQDTLDSVEVHRYMLKSYAKLIRNVDGITNQDHILEWLVALSGKTLSQITEAVGSLGNWGVDTSVNTVCKDCGKPITLEVNTNPVSFFI